MELKSSIHETWKYFTLGALLGCFCLLLILDNHQNTSLLAAQNAMFKLAPLKLSDSETSIIIEPLDASNVTLTTKDAQKFASDDEMEKTINKTMISKCNMFDGRWVYKPEASPSYDSNTCPFLEEKMSCRMNGRPDFEYEKWTWEAADCDIPTFNGLDMMERLRDKRMIIVGDSLNRNMWESLACLLYTSVPSSRVEVNAKNTVYKTLKAKDYNFTVEFYWSPFLIEFNEKHKSGKKVIVLDKLSPNSEHWQGADIMVFNSGHWWVHTSKLKSWDLFSYKKELTKEMPMEIAYKRAMTTWASWVKKNVDPKKTRVFFRSISAEHTLRKYDQWCYNLTQPMIYNRPYKMVYPKSLVNIIEGLIEKLGNVRVNYLNITKLSEYRIDAHPSIYRSKDWKILTKKFGDNISGYADCSHWCLPGVPDTWNRLLYSFIMSETGNHMPRL